MRKSALSLMLAGALSATLLLGSAFADCTNLLVSRGASKDGSVFITYSADAGFMPKLIYVPAADYKPGDPIDVIGWEDNEVRGQVKALGPTYSIIGLINEHQVAIGETTTGGRRELVNPEGLIDYTGLMILALKHAKTAREAIELIDKFCAEYGYSSSGETLSISDKNEVWMMEIIGKGPGVKGIAWVACRVPDGCITVHANMSRITTFPTDNPENWLYAPDVVDFAIEKGYYDPASGKPFSFRDAFHPDLSLVSKRVCAARVWSIYRRAAPSQDFPPDFHRGLEGAEDYPLFIEPDEKISAHDVMQLMRDHFEGTPYDMTQGIDAGPFNSPYRWRGLTWDVDGITYCWERPISTQQAGFVMVCQSRNWLPDPVGGVYWFTPDDCFTSVFVPFYCGSQALPQPYLEGDYQGFSWGSAWWVFNLVSNLTYDRYSRILPEVRKVQQEYESSYLEMMPVVDRAAAELGEKNPELMRRFVTNYSVSTGEELFKRWRGLCEEILTRHIDGFVKDEEGRARGIGYPEEWLRRIVEEKGEQLKIGPAEGH